MINSLKIALPKGSLQKPTLDLLEKAGYNIYTSDRGLRPSSDDDSLDIYMIRAQEIARYIDQGFIDCGITGLDWAYGHDVDLVDLAELPYSRASTRPTRWVLVVPEDSPIKTVQDLEGKHIATEESKSPSAISLKRESRPVSNFPGEQPKSKFPISSMPSSMSLRPDLHSGPTNSVLLMNSSPHSLIFTLVKTPSMTNGNATKWSVWS